MKKTITSDEYYDMFVDYIVENWKEKGTVKNEEDTREAIHEMLWLMSIYCPDCLIATLVNIGELEEEFNECLEDKNIIVED